MDANRPDRSEESKLPINQGGVILPYASALDDADPDSRHRAAFALAQAGDQKALKPLLHMLSAEAEQDEVRVRAAQAFGPLGESALEKLFKILQDDAIDIAWQARDRSKGLHAANIVAWKTPDLAVRAMGAIAEVNSTLQERIASVLLDTVRSDRVRFALSAFDVLAAIARRNETNRERIVGVMVELLGDVHLFEFGKPPRELGVRPVTTILATYYLGQIGSRAAVPALLDVLHNHKMGDRLPIEALGKMGDPAAVSELVRRLPAILHNEGLIYEPPSVFGSFPRVPALDAAWRNWASIISLQEQKTVQGIFPLPVIILLQYIWGMHADRGTLLTALRDIGGPAACAELANMLGYSPPQPTARRNQPSPQEVERAEQGAAGVRKVAAQILMRLGTAESLTILHEALADPSENVRLAASLALAETGDLAVVPTLQRLLHSPTARVYTVSAQSLLKLGTPEALALLLEALADPSQDVRFAAASMLKQSDDPFALDVLIGLLESPDQHMRKSAASELVNTPDALTRLPALRKALADPSDEVRFVTATALAKSGDPAVMAVLAGLLRSDDAHLRDSTARNLRKLGTPEALALLLEALADPSEHVRFAAVQKLSKVDDPSVPMVLIGLLESQDKGVRKYAATELARYADIPARLPALRRALADPADEVRLVAGAALAKVDDGAAIAVLVELLKSEDGFVRGQAVKRLGEIGRPDFIPLMIQALQDSSQNVREHAANVLRKIGDTSAVPALCEALNDKFFLVRCYAANALAKIGDPTAVPALINALNDEDSRVCSSAAAALERIATPDALAAFEAWRSQKLKRR